MKPIIRIKKIGGREYFYEVTPYYDPKTRRIRHRSRYLGKNVDGKPVRVRSKLPKHTYAYGEFLPFFRIASELKFEELLARYLLEDKVKVLLTLAYNRAVRPLPFSQIKAWYEGTVLSKMFGDIPISSQSLSTLMQALGNSDLPLEFSKGLISEVCTSSALIYDITSLSSYSELINLLEYGYNRDGMALPQLNLSMIVDRKIGIPVMYDIYPGSIVDVSTLKNTIKKVEYCGVHEFVLILDRGFFSTPNITELLANRISFIIPLPSRIKEAKRILSSIHAKINDPNRMQMYNNELIFVMPVKVEIGGNTLNAYAFYNPNREKEEQDAFYKRLYAVVETLKAVKLTKWMDAKDVVEEIAGEYLQYIEWSEKGERIDARIRAKAVAQRVNRMGKVILLYNGDFTWQEVLSMYRGKDIVEKGFEMLKHDIAALPMNAHKTETVKGFLFLCFLSLILRMRLLKQMQDTGLCEKYTVDALLLELEKIKKVELSNDEMLVTELTKKQKDILARLGLESFA